MSDTRAWTVSGASVERLDRHLAAAYQLPRNQVQQWIRAGHVLLNGRPAKASDAVADGDRIECHTPAPPAETLVPEPAEMTVLYEDAEVAVLDKPAGLTVHPGAGRPTGTLAHQLLARYPEITGVGGPGRPGIVHRLDQGTSGVMVVARTAAAYRRLSRAFADRSVAKRYLAIVYGAPPAAGIVDAPIGRHRDRRKEMTVRQDGRPARTLYRTLASAHGIALLDIDLATGRTHQIRVHLKSIGHPLIGDPVYGEARHRALPRPIQAPLRDFPRPALHAWRLALRPQDLAAAPPAPPAPAASPPWETSASSEPWASLPSSEPRTPSTPSTSLEPTEATTPTEDDATDAWQRFEARVPDDLRALWQAVTGTPFPELPTLAGWPPVPGASAFPSSDDSKPSESSRPAPRPGRTRGRSPGSSRPAGSA